MKRWTAWSLLPVTALLALANSAQALEDETYFDTNNWESDEYGLYDQDFAWVTDDPWYDDWNDTSTLAWNNAEEAQWDVFGYDDSDEWGLFDW